jgi:hypothetical protein
VSTSTPLKHNERMPFRPLTCCSFQVVRSLTPTFASLWRGCWSTCTTAVLTARGASGDVSAPPDTRHDRLEKDSTLRMRATYDTPTDGVAVGEYVVSLNTPHVTYA